MAIDTLPRLLLTHAGTLVAGFIVASWCYRSANKPAHINPVKPGFSIILATKRPESGSFGEKRFTTDRAVWLRSGTSRDENLCFMKLEGVKFHFEQHASKITGDLKQLPKLLPFLVENKTPEILPHEKLDNPPLPSCRPNPIITYGEQL